MQGGHLRTASDEGLTEKVTSVSTWWESRRCLQRTWSEQPSGGAVSADEHGAEVGVHAEWRAAPGCPRLESEGEAWLERHISDAS